MISILNNLAILSITAATIGALGKLFLIWRSSIWSSSQPDRVPVRVDVSSSGS